jgi:hypothetical protein
MKEKHRERKNTKKEETKHATHLEDRLLLLKVAHTATTSSKLAQAACPRQIDRMKSPDITITFRVFPQSPTKCGNSFL